MGVFKVVKLIGQGLNNTVVTGGLVPKGAYDAGVDYAVGDSVDYLGSSYVMHTNAAANTLPTDTTKWQVLANKGATGSTGATGAAGANGSNGSDGADGEGVPVGGTTGQALIKSSNDDFDTEWSSAGAGDMLAATYDGAAVAEQLVGLTATQTLTNKRLTSPKINEDVAITATATELNYTDGVTSAIQTQLDAKVAKSTYDAHTVLAATTDNTPVALTVGEQTVVGRATGGNIAAIAIDSELASVSASDDTIPSAKATKTALDAKAPLASPTFTGTVTLPVGLTGVVRTDTGVVSVDTDVTDIVAAASTTAAGKVELATDAETNTGTDTARAITPSNLEAWEGSAQVTTVGTLASGSATAIVAAASDTAAGKVELATIAETTTGTDATRAVTPDSLHDMTSLAGAVWFLDEDDLVSDSATKTASQQSIKAYVDANSGGTVDTANTPNANEFARFTDADTIEGRTAAEAKADLDLEIGTDLQAWSANLDEYAAVNPTAAGLAILDDADASAQRTTLGLAIGTNVQAYDAELAALAGLTSAADKGIQFTGAGTAGTYDLTTAGKALLDDANAAAQIATLGLDADIATLSLPASTTISAFSASFLDDANEATFKATVNLEANTDFYAPSGTDVAVADGGTGSSTAAGAIANLGGLPLAGGTMTGPITLAENTSLALDPAGSADGKYTGITVTGTGGATIAFGDLVTLDKDDSRWELVDISVAAAATGDARGIIGIAATSSTDGGAITVLLNGIIRADANFPALTIGAAVYASTTGDIVVAQPTTTDHVIRIIGFALTADEIYFNPTNDYITHT